MDHTGNQLIPGLLSGPYLATLGYLLLRWCFWPAFVCREGWGLWEKQGRPGESGRCVVVGCALLTASGPFLLGKGGFKETKNQGHGMQWGLGQYRAPPSAILWSLEPGSSLCGHVWLNDIAEKS